MTRSAYLPGTPTESLTPCFGRVDLDWVPEREARLVPRDLYRICRDCPLRVVCVDWAQQTDSLGYWGGTTTSNRRAAGDVADALAAAMRAQSALDQRRLARARRKMSRPPGRNIVERTTVGPEAA